MRQAEMNTRLACNIKQFENGDRLNAALDLQRFEGVNADNILDTLGELIAQKT